jgi:AcrR family transcriptional regulator
MSRQPARRAAHLRDGARERILAAALEVFAEQGFDGARTREIAERADANLGLIKYYFDGKEQLWKAAVTRAFAELQGDFTGELQPDAEDDSLAWLDRALRQFVRFVARHPEFMRLMNDEAKRDGPRMRWLADRFVRPMSEAVTAHLERAQSEGLIAPMSPVSLRYIVLGAAGLVFSQAAECKYVTGVDPTDAEFAERHADALMDLLTGRRSRRKVQ